MLIRPKAGILDPQGEAVERALPALGFAGVANVHVGRLVELDVEDPSQLERHVREAARESAGRGLRDPRRRLEARRGLKFGVLQFPGSCDEVDALHGRKARGRRRAVVARASATCAESMRSSSRRLLLRRLPAAGAIARFAPVMEAVIEFAARGGLVMGICNGFQVLCEARLLPGALLGNVNRRFTFRQVELEVVEADTAFTRACGANPRARPTEHPGQALLGALLRR